MPVSTGLYRTQKPLFGPLQRATTPLASGLVGAWVFNEAAGPAYSQVNPQDKIVLSSAATWGRSRAGPVVIANASTAYASLVTPSAALKPVVAVSMFWYGAIRSDGNAGGANPRIASLDPNNTNGSPFVSYGFIRPNTTDVSLAWNNGTYTTAAMTGVVTAYGTPQSFGLAMNTVSMRGFADGVFKVSSTTGVGAIQYAASAMLYVGGLNAASQTAGVDTSAIYIWNRKLDDAEFAQLHAAPFALFQPQPVRRWADAVTPLVSRGLLIGQAVNRAGTY